MGIRMQPPVRLPMRDPSPRPNPSMAAGPPQWSRRRPSAVERVVGSPTVRSAYASLVTHLLVLLVLGVAWTHRGGNREGRPLVIRFEQAAPVPADQGPPAVLLEPERPALDESAGSTAPVSSGSEALAVRDAITVEIEAPALPAPRATDPPSVASLAAATDAATAEGGPPSPRDARGSIAPNARAAAAGGGSRWRVRGGVTGAAFASRRGEAKGEAVRSRGGSAASEAAVEAGLEWLAAHQAPDGSWQCDLSGCGCNGACRDRGSAPGSVGATAIALLPFLGAGHTHQEGRWQQTVSAGLYYLLGRMRQTPRGGDLCEGSMYAHGIATLAFTEALGLTRDELFRDASRDVIRFIETSQDPHGGGWRYLPGQPGDTTVTGWQIVALKSGELAGLEIPSPVTRAAARFLDRMQSRGGAAYGYLSPSPKASTTAVGLLCRMYQGWRPGHQPLDDGIRLLLARGHEPQAVYTNFYLSQILLQADHPAWPRWNAHNRDMLLRMQARAGHEAGSWAFLEAETAPGGRLVHTALAVLTLEVYYRLLPIYGEEAVAAGF